jgi:ribA/ribD-fused uncharacterized protein
VDIAHAPENAPYVRSDWFQVINTGNYQVRDYCMEQALLLKFWQHHDLLALLLSTGDKLLVEHTEKDKYWGDNGDGTGANRLGLLLMKVRARLRQLIRP